MSFVLSATFPASVDKTPNLLNVFPATVYAMAGTCQSFLQKLPLEVRLLIYEQCFFAERENCRVFRPSWADLPKDTTAPSIPPTSPATYPIKANITALPLILTCRQMYGLL